MDFSKLERIAAAGFQLVPLPNIAGHIAAERDGFAALIAIDNDDLGRAGSTGLLTPEGLAVLVWRGTDAWFVARGFERRAEAGEVDALRKFAEELKSALGS